MVAIKLSILQKFPNAADNQISLDRVRSLPTENWEPIVLDDANNVVDGTHRVAVAIERGLTEIDAVYLTDLTDDEIFKLTR